MAWTFPSDAFSWFYLLFFGAFFVAALLMRGNRRSATDIALPDAGPAPARPDRIANRLPGRLTETGLCCGHTRVREFDIPGLEACAQQFEDAIEKIWLRQ